jgi:hypothetical protein
MSLGGAAPLDGCTVWSPDRQSLTRSGLKKESRRSYTMEWDRGGTLMVFSTVQLARMGRGGGGKRARKPNKREIGEDMCWY